MSTVWARSRVRADASPFSSSFPNRRPSNNKTNQPPTNRVTQAICRPGSTTQAALATEALATQASLAKPPVEAPPVGTIEALLSATEAPPSGATVKDSSIRAPPVNAPTSFVDLAVQVEHVEAELLAGDQAATKAVDASPAAAGVAVHVNAVEPVTVEETGASFARVCLASETQSVEESVAEMSVPEAVKRAIASFQSTAEFTLSPPRHNESSFIYKWGVRVTQLKDGKEQVGWICLASQYCRDHIEVLRLYSGKASQATKHLKDVHNCISEKYTAEMSRKRTREEELNDLRASLALNPDPKRMRLLVETKRIIMGRLPFRSVESDEFRLISDLCVKEELQRLLSARLITNTIVELYSSTKREIVHLLRDNGVMDGKLVTVMADLWTCKPQHKKYLGVRIYFIGKAWKMRSVILGMRLFNPGFGERDTALGIRPPISALD